VGAAARVWGVGPANSSLGGVAVLPPLKRLLPFSELRRGVARRAHADPHRGALATKHWRLLGARSQGEVHGFYVAQLRRRMGVTAVREQTSKAAFYTSLSQL
jgi:hypothetical protein